MSRVLFTVLLISLWTANGLAATCTKPKVTVNAFSTQDATILTTLAHVGEFTLTCGNGEQPALFAEFPCGALVPVARIGDNKYQVSWTEEIKKGSSGNVVVRLFDEDGYTDIRKAQRDGESINAIKSLIDISVPTKGAYKGPWVKAELLAAVVVSAVAYFAFTTKSKVQL
ncbi:translocon-associated protein subunit delta-like [Teleopsis dalmanni]|uniref:translocon-associated protein subunit delta n=1 Tax=Teleopsis dalmanni TaxID=139649 RepID=UPI000D329692|nr:translocon-associated protein subunit delta [Teleopsis dalmanni]XP_037949515.1 translocon-associated protein subunit delta-like [Teleopsis dalmanni]